MLPKHHRLPASDIPKVKARGNQIRSPFFYAFILKTPSSSSSRFSFIVSLKVSKKAVNRNKINRLLRQAVIAQPGLRGKDAVVIARKKILDKNLAQIKVEIKKLNL